VDFISISSNRVTGYLHSHAAGSDNDDADDEDDAADGRQRHLVSENTTFQTNI